MKTYVHILSIVFLLHCIHACVAITNSTTEHYIVYMGKHSLSDSKTVISSNHELLASVVGSVGHARKATVHHYHKSFRGFSARLTQEQANRIAKSGSVVSVFKSRLYELHTTRSWDFMLANGDHSPFGDYSVNENYDVVIGHIDSGVWPESPSFTPAEGMDKMPKGFKGECVTGEQFSTSNCNGKIIGARYYYIGFEQHNGPLERSGRLFYRSARDDFSHGTHTASTAAGAQVTITDALGGGQTARGGAPRARLAVYKACWFNLCDSSDILKAFDNAVDDGVDVITISAGDNTASNDYFDDVFSIGAFHAFLKRIVTSASAGNSGSMGPGYITNSAPWALSVAASSIDREFVSNIQLGNGYTLKGYGWNNKYQMDGFYYVIAGGDAAMRGVSREDANFCKWNTLDTSIIERKVVVCFMETGQDNYGEKSSVVRYGGGVGMIIVNPYDEKDHRDFVVPTSVINQEEANKLGNYIASVREPNVKILPSVINYDVKPAPKMAYFSSKGPNRLTPEIIKPDITAPGVNILASGLINAGPANAPYFFLDSGTSMACPHVSGVATVIKAIYPDWSAAEVKSAIMTTALPGDNTGNPIQSNTGRATPFDMGSGHLNPNAAINPGLVYDMSETDVYYFLCSHGVGIDILRMLFESNTANCSNSQTSAYDLNLPSIGINNLVGGVSVTRKVTYRSNENNIKVFNVRIENPQGIEIRVSPSVLDFSGGQKTLTFKVDVYPRQRLGEFVFGSLTWYNNIFSVRSPIAVKAINN